MNSADLREVWKRLADDCESWYLPWTCLGKLPSAMQGCKL